MIPNYDPRKTFYENIVKEAPPKRVRLIPAKTAAKILRCKTSTVGRWRREGYISYLQGGKRYFYKLHEILFLAYYRSQGRMEKLTKKMNNEKL